MIGRLSSENQKDDHGAPQQQFSQGESYCEEQDTSPKYEVPMVPPLNLNKVPATYVHPDG